MVRPAQQVSLGRNEWCHRGVVASRGRNDHRAAATGQEVHSVATTSQPIERVVNVEQLGRLVKARRAAEGMSLRELQDQIQNALSASALSRIENGATPEPKNVAPLAAWLGIPMGNIAWPGQPAPAATDQSTPDVIAVHLRADKKLNPVAAETLARMFRRLYEDLVEERITLAGEQRPR
jgi:transcriptional regulator with XRE-family HTH domain